MAYLTPTPATFKTRYPVFAAVDDAIIQAALNEAAGQVDATWLEADYNAGWNAYAAHILTMEGQGTSTEAQFAGFQSLSIGSLSLTRDVTNSKQAGTLGSTSFGARYLELLKRNRGGPLVANG